jgi:hypothetical protein
MTRNIQTSSTFVNEPSVFDEWLKSKRNSKSGLPPMPLPPKVKYTGIQRVFDIAHKTIIYTCIGTSVLLAGQLALWIITGEGRKHREEAIAAKVSAIKNNE